jgi:tetraacyldisaccharide 4'-kinase
MIPDTDDKLRQILTGADRSPQAALLRTAAAAAEPFFALAARVRNKLYDAGILKAHSLGRPTISVGNLTTGGTGKTPVVAWLCKKLEAAGQSPAVLLRGYKTTSQGVSDEADVLKKILGPDVPVIPNPDRVRAAADALVKNPKISTFVLDDAMQHRRARRDFELVLLHAAAPFGYNHILPRGLLREPQSGLRRASAILITHASEADLSATQSTIREYNAKAPIFRCDHVITGFRGAEGNPLPSTFLQDKKYFAFCALGSPESFAKSLAPLGSQCTGTKFFSDHHAYTPADIAEIRKLAAGADVLITTEKDWAKLAAFPDAAPPILRAQLQIHFPADHESKLFESIQRALHF